MTGSLQDLIDGHLDGTLTSEQHLVLGEMIRSNPEHAHRFAASVMLHDRMRNEFSYSQDALWAAEPIKKIILAPNPVRAISILATAAGMSLIACFLLWSLFGPSSVSAAMRELDRVIEKNLRFNDRTYLISVEKVIDPPRRGKPLANAEEQRPPKVSLDGAVLHVRSGNQFVLIRKDSRGESFITGSDGRTSWAVRSDGPVRVSRDLNRFNRDLPGHENAVPLTNIHEGLELLRQTYDVQFLPVGPEEFQSREGAAYRRLVAVKKPRQRGPQRVEIGYEANSGCIQDMRFIQMPFGTDLLDLRMRLIEEQPLNPGFFEHRFHQPDDRVIQFED